jgi:hypothetical protein
MNSYRRLLIGTGCLLVLVMMCLPVQAQQGSGMLHGQVKDQFGGIILGATVTAIDAAGTEKTTTTKDDGTYTIVGLTPGKYLVRVAAAGFAQFEATDVEVATGRTQPFDVTMQVTIEDAKVNVAAESPVSTEPENNQSALVLRGTDIEALPDDPDDLEAALQALAGPSAGPNGGQIYIDGFTGGRLPPKASIREIRVNQNPFSAEYDRLGMGRIEILTKPGTDKFRGQGFFNFNDDSLNSRNPFLQQSKRPPYQRRLYGGNLSGPIVSKKASFFLDFQKRDINDNTVINAQILNTSDPTLPVETFSQAVVVPRRIIEFSPRIDYQLNEKNTIVGRYSYESNTTTNAGLNEFTLPEKAYDTKNTEQSFQITETAVINTRVINETRFQFLHQRSDINGNNSIPSISVRDAFSSGGAQVGKSFNTQNRWELQNNTTWTMGPHSFKAGVRFRNVNLTDFSVNNFGGSFTFVSLNQYRNVLLNTPGATVDAQFSINAGNPEAKVRQLDFGGFVQDDWKLKPNFTLSWGLRYENQTNIKSNLNFAPRVALAWSPGGGGNHQSKTVIRAGAGIFYDRISENLTLQADRFNGENQLSFTIPNPVFFPNVPTLEQIEKFPGVAQGAQITRQLAPNLRVPYIMQGVFSVERQLPYKFTVTASFVTSRTLHQLRTVDINAPLPGTFKVCAPGEANCVSSPGVRPFGNVGEIYQYDSSGIANQNQLIISFNNRLNPRFTLFGNYSLGKANGNTDGSGTYPANPYDFSTEYGRSGFDIRQRVFLGGSITAPWGIRLNPFIMAFSGRPFNITTGLDTNGDRIYSERPSIAPANASCSDRFIRCTPYGNFNLIPGPNDVIIERNYGQGPGYFSVNIGASKTFGFGDVANPNAAAASQGAGGRGGRGGGAGGGGGRGFGGGMEGGGRGGGMFGGGGGSTEKRYNLTFMVRATNLFNRVNPGNPVGNLSSSLFGQSNATSAAFGGFGPGGNSAAGNRQFEVGLRFSF